MLARQAQNVGVAGLSNVGPPLPTLAKASLPMDQLVQLQRRLAHLLSSLNEFQAHVANAVALDEWPALVGRHLTLVAQTHSLSQILSLGNPNALNVKLAKRQEILLNESHHANKFDLDGNAGQPGSRHGDVALSGSDALFGGGQKDANLPAEFRLPHVKYSDGQDNPIARIDPHPFLPIDSDKSQTVIPSLLLPRGIDEKAIADAEQAWQAWLERYAGLTSAQAQAASIDMKCSWIPLVRQQIVAHDAFAEQAIRSFVHAREATDEAGQRYDWQMRLSPDEDDYEEEELEGRAVEDVEMKEDADGANVHSTKQELDINHVRNLLRTGNI